MSILAVITARGGSRGLPGKNILPFAGKPMIAYSIEAALAAEGGIERVIVSTDDPAIAEVSRSFGADVPFTRPAELACADTPSLPVVQHAASFAEREKSRDYDWVLLLQPTSPLRTAGDISAAIAMADTSATAVISVTDAGDSHPMKLRVVEDGILRAYGGGPIKPVRRQDFGPPVYKVNGAIYLTRRDVLMQQNDLYGERPLAYVMPPERSIDIDTKAEFVMAEFLFQGAAESRGEA